MANVLRCNYCPRWTSLTEAGARFLGWRIFRGESLTGATLDDVICPVHSGRGEDPGIPSWDIQCDVCDWRFLENLEPGDAPLISAEEALEWSQNHQCEPVFRFVDPGNGKNYMEFDSEFRAMVDEGRKQYKKKKEEEATAKRNRPLTDEEQLFLDLMIKEHKKRGH